MIEFEDEMRKQGVGLTTELEYGAYVDDTTIATTAELAPLVMDRLKEILERHGLELRSDKCTACCPTPERADGVREGNDAICEIDSQWPHDLGNGQRRGISNEDHDRGSKKSRGNEWKATKRANPCWQDQANVRNRPGMQTPCSCLRNWLPLS